MVKITFTETQKQAVWIERVALERHHDSALPSQRYKESRKLPPKLNPIVPQDVDQYSQQSGAPFADFPPSFLELNAPRQRPPLLGNPLFGYSCHPIAPPVKADSATKDVTSAAAASRLAELQEQLKNERARRLDLEAQLSGKF